MLIRMDLCMFVIVGYKFSNDFTDVVTLAKGVCVCICISFFFLYCIISK